MRPSDIVRMTNGEISLQQASTWLSKLLMSASTRNLLLRLCDEKLSDGTQYAAEVSIYTISHPTTNNVVYVGATSNMDRRKAQHLLMAKNGSEKPLYEWIRSLPSEPIFSEIEVCPGNNAANIRELYWISEYAKAGSIFNEMFDGDGRLPSDESVTRSMVRAASISELGISPSSIVKLSNGDVSFQTAGKWLKSVKPSVAVKYALMYFRLKLGSAENFSEGRVTGQYGSQKVEFGPAKVEVPSAPLIGEAKKRVKDFELPSGSPGTCVEKVPAKKPSVPVVEKRTVTLQPFALNTMDDPMTRKIKSDKGFNYWILYCKENKYRLELADAGCSIVTEEGTFVLSDFAKK